MLSRKLLNFATLLPLLLLNNSIYNNTIFENHRLPTIPNPSHQTPFPIPSSEGKVILFFPFHVVPIMYCSWGLSSFAFLFALVGLNLSFAVWFLEGALLIVCLYCNPGARALPSSLKPGTKQDEPSKELPKFSVKLFLHSSGHVAVKFQYDQVIISAFRRIPRASWNAKESLNKRNREKGVRKSPREEEKKMTALAKQREAVAAVEL
ncbi:hypothetical protein AHAS_Ahas11G0266600 [Arachis hypogaea]